MSDIKNGAQNKHVNFMAKTFVNAIKKCYTKMIL